MWFEILHSNRLFWFEICVFSLILFLLIFFLISCINTIITQFFSFYLIVLDLVLEFQFYFLKIIKFGFYTLKTTLLELKLMVQASGKLSSKFLIHIQRQNLIANNTNITKDEKERLPNNLKEKWVLHFALLSDKFRFVISLLTAHAI